MEIFIDSGNTNEIREAQSMGIVDGVTTNPSLASKSGKSFKDLILEICGIVNGPVSAEVTTTDAEEMIKEGCSIALWHKNIVVKMPLTADGLKAIRSLSESGIRTNATLCFSSSQALLAAKAGATYVSPFVGRLDDIGSDGMELIADIRAIYDRYQFRTKIITASVRHPLHFLQAAQLGSDAITAPWKVLQQVVQHPLTDIGLKKFMDDWAKAKKN
ncbi:MAG: fructose-6-phosphate aldolase [bacterium]